MPTCLCVKWPAIDHLSPRLSLNFRPSQFLEFIMLAVSPQSMALYMTILQDFWTWRLQESPEFATSIGLHEHDERLDDLRLDAFERRKSRAEEFLKKIDEIDSATLNDEQVLSITLLKAEIEQYLSGMKFKSYLFPLNQLEGPQLDFPRLISWMKFNFADDYEKALSRFRSFPMQIDQIITLLRYGIDQGITMAKVSVSPVPDQLNAVISKNVNESNFFKPFLTFPDSIDTLEQNRIRAEAEELLTKEVWPAYKRLIDYLKDEYVLKVRQNISISSLPGGKDLYQEYLKFHTTTNMKAEEIHELGKKEVTRITAEMETIKEKVGFTGLLTEFQNYLRNNSKLQFKDEKDILNTYENLCAETKKKLPSLFKRFAKKSFVIKPVPAEVAANFPGAYYLNPSDDGTRPGTFYINTYEPTSRMKYEAVSLTLHESEPGHHLQSALAMEMDSLPKFRRYVEDRVYWQAPGRFALNTGYLEGWGLYCEYLGEEMGMYKDPYDYFGRLSHEMLRACRLVVDTGMHALGWSREEAIEYMKSKTAMSASDIIAEIERYITWPGQACAYKIGELKLKELRKKAETALQNNFDIKDFHNVILSAAAVPLHILADIVDDYIHKVMAASSSSKETKIEL